MIDALGWFSSALLLVTIGVQVTKQWREKTSKGVSLWMFIGQMAASTGFVVYSTLVRNTVFIVTNTATFVAAIIGLALTLLQKRRGR